MAEKIVIETKLVNEKMEGNSITTNIIDLQELDFKNPEESPIKTITIKGPKGDDPYNLMKYMKDFYAAGFKPENEQDILEIIAVNALENMFRESEPFSDSLMKKHVDSLNYNKYKINLYNGENEELIKNMPKGGEHIKIEITPLTNPMTVTYNNKKYDSSSFSDKKLTIELENGLSSKIVNKLKVTGLTGRELEGEDSIYYTPTLKGEGLKPLEVFGKKAEYCGTIDFYRTKLSPLIEAQQAKMQGKNAVIWSNEKEISFNGVISVEDKIFYYFPLAEKIQTTIRGSRSVNGICITDIQTQENDACLILNMPKLQKTEENLFALASGDEESMLSGVAENAQVPVKIIIPKDHLSEFDIKVVTKMGLTKHQYTDANGNEVDAYYNDSLWEENEPKLSM